MKNEQHNRRVILTSGTLWAAFNGLTSVYLAAYALVLGASNTIIGLLAAMPFLAHLLAELPGAALVEHVSRKRIYLTSALIARFWWIPLLFAPYILRQPLVPVILFYFLYRLGESFKDPSWNSLFADVVSEKTRGDFVSARFRLIAISAMIVTILGGLWLRQFPKESPLGFSIMFLIGAILGILAVLAMGNIKEPPYKDHRRHKLRDFFRIPNSGFKTFLTYSLVFDFGFKIAAPLFVVYWLKNLNMSYTFFAVAIATSTLTQFIVSRHIGTWSDKVGDKPVAIFGSIGTSLTPLLHIFITPATAWAVIPVQVLNGIAWAAADISRFNLLLDVTKTETQALQIAEYKFYTAIPLVIAPVIGGWLSEHATLILTGIPLIFLLGFLLRAASALLLLRLKEPRAKRETPLPSALKEAFHFHVHRGMESHIKIFHPGGLRQK